MTAASVPPVTEADLLAYVDGQLPPRRRAEVEAHLLAAPEDAERVVADLTILEGLRVLFDIGCGVTPCSGYSFRQ